MKNIHKPCKMDNLCDLNELTAESIIHVLSDKHIKEHPYTMCGDMCISVNPYQWLPLYGPEISEEYRLGKNLQPHIYLIVKQALEQMNAHKQSILISGESGSGKSEGVKLMVNYIACGCKEDTTLVNFVTMCGSLLEVFGNAQTCRNKNSSRFGKFITIRLQDATFHSASICTYLLEKSRVTGDLHASNSNFHIFHSFSEDQDMQQKHKIQRHDMYHFPFVINSGEPFMKWSEFDRLISTTDIRDMMPEIELVLCCILELSRFCDSRNNVDDVVERVSECFQVEPVIVRETICQRRRDVHEEKIVTNLDINEISACASSLCRSLYEELFHRLVSRLNMNSKKEDDNFSKNTVSLLDIFGFESFEQNSFEQICINYANEHLQHIFVNDVVIMRQKEYEEEGINYVMTSIHSQKDVIHLFDRRAGLIDLIDEECKIKSRTQTSTESLNLKILNLGSSHISSPRFSSKPCFLLIHFADTVLYNTSDFVERNNDTLRTGVVELTRKSAHNVLKGYMDKHVEGMKQNSLFGKTVLARFRENLLHLIQEISDCQRSYIRCLKPNEHDSHEEFDNALLLRQLKCSGIVEGCKVLREGYAMRMSKIDFIRLYGYLLSDFDAREYAIGSTKIFLKDGALKKMQEHVRKCICIQSAARALMCRRLCKKLFQNQQRNKLFNKETEACTRIQRAERKRKAWREYQSSKLVRKNAARFIQCRHRYILCKKRKQASKPNDLTVDKDGFKQSTSLSLKLTEEEKEEQHGCQVNDIPKSTLSLESVNLKETSDALASMEILKSKLAQDRNFHSEVTDLRYKIELLKKQIEQRDRTIHKAVQLICRLKTQLRRANE